MVTGEPRFWFRSGHVALDLALSGGDDLRARWERLAAPSDLADWLAASDLGVGRLPVSGWDLAVAHELRDAIWPLAHATSDGKVLPGDAVAMLNDHASRPRLAPGLDGQGRRRWRQPTAAAALAHIAAEAVELLGGPRADRVRRCAGDRCWLLFLDTSPPGRRRWCSMERCGNRAKVRAHRRLSAG
jgi:predicted RNA-binding Zn ribbon-like protein